jgi:Protein of unknown function (DUF1579)
MADNDIDAQRQPREPGPEHELLDVFIGRWITEGHTVASADAPSVEILASDVYEWMPGGFFVAHTAYGRVGNTDVGGTEIIGYDATSNKYRTHNFDSQGDLITEELSVEGDTWTWKGDKVGCTAEFTDDGKRLEAHHVRLDDDGNWVPSMEVTLTKVE